MIRQHYIIVFLYSKVEEIWICRLETTMWIEFYLTVRLLFLLIIDSTGYIIMTVHSSLERVSKGKVNILCKSVPSNPESALSEIGEILLFCIWTYALFSKPDYFVADQHDVEL